MSKACWKDMQETLRSNEFVTGLLFGVQCIPKHIAFVYVGKKCVVACGNVGSKHAEHHCLDKIRRICLPVNKPVRLIVTKLHGQHRYSRPCRVCASLIKRHLPMARVFFTDHGGELVEDYLLDNNHLTMAYTGRSRKMSVQHSCDI